MTTRLADATAYFCVHTAKIQVSRPVLGRHAHILAAQLASVFPVIVAVGLILMCTASVSADGLDYFDVKDFGAAGDGRTDDTEAIKSAIAAAGRGTVYVPQGVYLVTSPITLGPGVSLLGRAAENGSGGSVLRAGADMDCVVRTDGWGHHMAIESLTIDGGADQGHSVGWALELLGFCDSRVGNVKIHNIDGGGIYIGTTHKSPMPSWVIYLDKLDIEVQRDHYGIHNRGTDSFWKHVRVSGGRGILNEGGGNVLNNLIVENSNGSGLTHLSGGISVVESVFRNNMEYGVAIQGNVYSTLSGNRFEDNTLGDMSLVNAQRVLVTQNVFKTEDTESGQNVLVHNSDYISFAGNRFAGREFELSGSHTVFGDNEFDVSDFSTDEAGPRPAIDLDMHQLIYDVTSKSSGLVVYNVRSMGAVGDGVADDTRAIQNAMDSVPAGGVVYFPKGTYLVSSPLILRDDIILLGDGNRSDVSVIKAVGDLDYLIKTDRSTTGVLMTRLCLSNAPLGLLHLKDSVLDRIRANGGAILGRDSRNVLIWDSSIRCGSGDSGPSIQLEGYGNTISGLYSNRIDISGAGGHLIYGCNLDLCRGIGSIVFTNPDRDSTDVVVRNCYFQLNDHHVIVFDYEHHHSANVSIEHCLFRSNGTYRATREEELSADFVGEKMVVTTADPEIYIRNGQNISITGSMFRYTDIIDHPDIRKGVLQLAGDVDHIAVVGNKLRGDIQVLRGDKSVLRDNLPGMFQDLSLWVTDEIQAISVQDRTMFRGDGSWTDYLLQAEVRARSNEPFEFMIRYCDNQNYYALAIDPSTSRIQLVRCIDGVRTILDEAEQVIQSGTWYTLGLEAFGDCLTGSVNGEARLEAIDGNLVSGRLGMRFKLGDHSLRNVLVIKR